MKQFFSTKITAAAPITLGLKFRALFQLLKFRLSFLVALSGMFGYAIAADAAGGFSWGLMLWIGFGGLLVTGASNVLNQIIEREHDRVMNRTQGRPLPQGILSNLEATLYAVLLMVVGIGLIGHFFNLPAALLALVSLLLYAFVYTPMKRISPIAVFIGAIPGALPPLIGWVGVTGALDTGGLLLFAFQFFWQFPHFWAIAWVADADYRKAGFRMLPTEGGKNKATTLFILIYTLALVPLAFFPWQIGLVGEIGAGVIAALGLAFTYPAWKLYQSLEDAHAKRLMFASFLYLPLMQIAFLVG